VEAKVGELEALPDEVRKAQFAESNQAERAKDLEEELARVRIASARKVSEEDAALYQAFPLLFELVRYLKDCCRKPSDKNGRTSCRSSVSLLGAPFRGGARI
jgi:hypothetical protein